MFTLTASVLGSPRRRRHGWLSLRAGLVAGGLATATHPVPAAAQRTNEVTETNRTVIRRAFDAWARGGTRFFDDVLAPDAVWTIVGSGPNAGVHRGRQAFLDRAVAPFSARLSAPLVPTVRGLWADGNQVIALFDGRATARDGQPYYNTYAWFFTMRDGRAVAVTAFLNLPAYDAVLARVRPAARD